MSEGSAFLIETLMYIFAILDKLGWRNSFITVTEQLFICENENKQTKKDLDLTEICWLLNIVL